MSRSLLLAAPSVPRVTFTPTARNRATGQKPAASFRFDSGQWTTWALAWAMAAISNASSCVGKSTRIMPATARIPASAAALAKAASRVPARTNSGSTQRCSAGQICWLSQVISGRSSANPRSKVMGE